MRTTKFYTLLTISKPFAFNVRYYDIDNIFTDKTTYFHWLPKEIINIIKLLTIINYQRNYIIHDIKYDIFMKIYGSFGLSHDEYPNFRQSYYIKRLPHKYIKELHDTGHIKIYRKRPYCNIV